MHQIRCFNPEILIARAKLVVLALVAAASIVATCAAQSGSESSGIIREVEIGFGDVVKIGHWVPIKILLDKARVPFNARLELATVDADAVPVIFRSVVRPNDQGWVVGHVCFGRMSAGLTVQLVDPQGKIVASRDLSGLDKLSTIVSATEQVLLQLGSPLNLPASGQTSSAKPRRVIKVTDVSELPEKWFEYDGVDLVVLSTAGTENIALAMSELQIEALWEWVQMGGRLVLSVGQNAANLIGPNKPFARFAPGVFQKAESLSNSDSLEFYAGSATGQLITDPSKQSLSVAGFDQVDGFAEVSQNNRPVIVRRCVGFGDIVFVCFDLEQSLITDWKGNARLLSQLLGYKDEDVSLIKSAQSDLGTNYGFRDLSGQVRAVGEKFTGVSVVTFMLIAALIVLYSLCIGPGDYLLLKKVFGRMEWTWVTSTLMTLVFGGIAWALVANSKPNKILINQTEVVDVDAAGQTVRGGVWTNLFSPQTRLFDLAIPENNELGMSLDSRMISAIGMPGDGIGGMESRTAARLFGDSYAIEMKADVGPATTQIEASPVAVGSTKQFFAKWTGHHGLSDLGEVTFRERGKQMGGSFRNPFQHELRDCYLLYGNTVYVLGNVRIGSSIDLGSGTERSLKDFLQFKKPNSEVAQWPLANRESSRVFPMLMFFRAAGGQDFTGLTNDYQNEFDLSEQLAIGRAIFVGRIDGFVANPLAIESQGGVQNFDHQTTFARFVFPVRFVKSSSR